MTLYWGWRQGIKNQKGRCYTQHMDPRWGAEVGEAGQVVWAGQSVTPKAVDTGVPLQVRSRAASVEHQTS